MALFDRIWRAYGAFLHGLGLVAGAACFVMMAMITVNVLGRYLLNTPLPGTFEVSQSLLTVLIFFSMALTQYHHGHIQVIFLTRGLPPRIQQVLAFAMLLIGAAVFGLATYATWGFALESYRVNEQEWGAIRYPIYPIKFVVFFGLALLTIQFVLDAVRVATGRESASASGGKR